MFESKDLFYLYAIIRYQKIKLLELPKEDMDKLTSQFETQIDLIRHLLKNKYSEEELNKVGLIMENCNQNKKVIMCGEQVKISNMILKKYPYDVKIRQVFKDKQGLFEDTNFEDKYMLTPLKRLRMIYETYINSPTVKSENLEKLYKEYNESHHTEKGPKQLTLF